MSDKIFFSEIVMQKKTLILWLFNSQLSLQVVHTDVILECFITTFEGKVVFIGWYIDIDIDKDIIF